MLNNIAKLRIQRRSGESIVIGHNIEITFEKLEPTGLISCVIKAPRAIAVHRKEVYERLLSGKAPV